MSDYKETDEVILIQKGIIVMNLIFHTSYLSHACEEFTRIRHTRCEELMRILNTCDKYEMGKMRFNKEYKTLLILMALIQDVSDQDVSPPNILDQDV